MLASCLILRAAGQQAQEAQAQDPRENRFHPLILAESVSKLR